MISKSLLMSGTSSLENSERKNQTFSDPLTSAADVKVIAVRYQCVDEIRRSEAIKILQHLVN